MELAGKLLQEAILDSFVFMAQLIALYFVSTRRHVGYERYFMMCYGLIALSAYNIYIKFIHDYNIPIARTALNKLNIIGSIYLIDIFVLSATIILLIRYVVRPTGFRWALNNRVIASAYGLNLLVYLISCIGYYYYSETLNQVSFVSQIRPVRGLLLGFVAIWAFTKLSSRLANKKQAHRIVITLVLIDVINVIGELISAQIFHDYVWQRGGHDVILLNQANSSAAITYIPILLTSKRFDSRVKVFGLLYIGLLLYDYTKGLYILIPLVILGYGLVSVFYGRLAIKYAALICIIIFASFLILPSIFKDRAISGTRSIQLNSYWQAVEHLPATLAYGSGFGGKYSLLAKTDDGGEMKSIERDEADDQQVQFQVPVFIFFKVAGFIGISLAIATVITLFFWAFKAKPLDPMVSMYIILVMILCLIETPFLHGEPNSNIYFVRCLFMISMLVKLIHFEKNNKSCV